MHRFIPILVAFAFGCNNFNDVAQPATRPAPTATLTTATGPLLKPIELHYGIYLARLDLRITISGDGVLRSVRTDNKSYDGKDIDATRERIEIREGRLTDEQMADLARLFAGWSSLSSKPYSGVPNKRGKPDGAVAAWVYSFVGTNYPADPSQWDFQGATTKSTHEIVFPDTVASGAQVWICAAWINAKQEPGPASVPITTNVQGGGMAQAA
jgi:hypothetical protein